MQLPILKGRFPWPWLALLSATLIILSIFPAAYSQDLNSGLLECDAGGGTFKVILDASDKTTICVALVSGPNCQAILRELAPRSKEVVVQGGPQIACLNVKKAAVICKGTPDGANCKYQVVSVGSTFDPLFIYILLGLVLAMLFIILLFIFLRWRALGPFMRPQ